MVLRIREDRGRGRVHRFSPGVTSTLRALVLACAWCAPALTSCQGTSSAGSPGVAGGSGGAASAACQQGQSQSCACGDGTSGVTFCQNGNWGPCTGCPQSTAGTGQAGFSGGAVSGTGGSAVAGMSGGAGGGAVSGTGGGAVSGAGGNTVPIAGSGASNREKPATCAGLSGMDLTVCHKQINDEIPMGCENLTGDAQTQCCQQIIDAILDNLVVEQYYPECVASSGQEPQVGPCTLQESESLAPSTQSNPVTACFFGPDGPAGSQGCDAQHGAMADPATLSRCMPDCLTSTTSVSPACADCFGQAQVSVNTICYQSGQCAAFDVVCNVTCIGTTFPEEYDKCFTRE